MKTKKHNHTLTNILKVLVFSLMILMPFIIFIPNAFYYGFNEQAVAQEKTEQVPVYYESNVVNSINDLIIGNIYFYSNNYVNNYVGSSKTLMTIDIDVFKQQYPNYIDRNVTQVSVFITENNGIQLYIALDNTGNTIDINARAMQFVPLSLNNTNVIENNLLSYISKSNALYIKEYQPLITNMSITDSMSYAWKSTWQNELFSWTGTTAIYNGINATTSGIGISENSYIANYLAYIFLLTIIYIIVDIILGVFTMLTHIFNKEPK